MKALSDLIELLEKAEGPSREVDAEIDAALFGGRPAHAFTEDHPGARLRRSYGAGTVFDHDDPQANGGHVVQSMVRTAAPVTASLDAATALVKRVLPGFGVSVETHPVYGDWWDAAIFDRMPKTIANARKQTAALAICLALLRALQQEDRR